MPGADPGAARAEREPSSPGLRHRLRGRLRRFRLAERTLPGGEAMTEPHGGANVPELPLPQELEAMAAQATASLQGCWWVTAQASVHLLNVAARRDAHSGELMAQPLSEILAGIARQANAVRPVPA